MQEKTLVAASSVVAAIFLTTLKIAVGVGTGSLGMLSEAAHSALDLIAAGITLVAVRVSARPADRNHPYGHGKIENLSALIEAALLIVTCVAIINEAIQRLFFKPVEVDASLWALGVMLISIVVDFSRSRALGRVAQKYHSQALAADALHFSTDILSSIVVFIGLALVKLGEWARVSWLERSDAVAAFGVALIVIVISVRLGKRASEILLDTAPDDLPDEIQRRARMVEGVLDATQVRVRRGGAATFVDLSIAVERAATFEEAHRIASAVENIVKQTEPDVDVLVHVDPVAPHGESVLDAVRGLAAKHDLTVHSVHVQHMQHQLVIHFHVEVDDRLTLQEAHALVSHLEGEVKRVVPNVADVVSHIEPAGRQGAQDVIPVAVLVCAQQEVERIARAECGMNGFHEVTVHSVDGALDIALHVVWADQSPIREAHDLTTRLETQLRRQIPNVGSVLVHVEPRSIAAS